METAEFVYAELSASEDEFSTADSSDDSEEELGSDYERQRHLRRKRPSLEAVGVPLKVENVPKNLQQKLLNMERTGNFAGSSRFCHLPPRAFNKVPNRLGFCLKNIVPHCFLQGHMFMGLSACGQFLLSYKVCCNDNVSANHYSFNIGYKYTLYFWIYQPHKPLRSFYKCCLFDDHGVDNLKDVTMTQWKCADPRVLIVHGAAEDENEDSYITYVKVPKLGCADCKKLRDLDDNGLFRWYALCLKCNLTIHTKYSSTESDPKFNSYVNLICPERILIIANGFVHMLHIELMPPAAPTVSSTTFQHMPSINSACGTFPTALLTSPPPSHDELCASERRSVASFTSSTLMSPEENIISCDNHNNIIARIIADFSDIETDSTHSNSSSRQHAEMQRPSPSATLATHTNESSSVATCISRKTYDELIFTCNGSTSNSTVGGGGSAVTAISGASSTLAGGSSNASNSKGVGCSTKVSLISHKGKRHHRIVTKSYRSGVITVDMQGTSPATSSTSTASSSSTSTSIVDKSNAYEFSEDNEKCEKIATLRKRRLADKKYEFSEDNSENIIPFTKIRLANKSIAAAATAASASTAASLGRAGLHRAAGNSAAAVHHFYSSPCASPSSSPHQASSSGGSFVDSRSHCTTSPIAHHHRASPISLQQGFRSPPCGSPVGAAAVMRSPSRHCSPAQSMYNQKSPPMSLSLATQQMLSFKPLGTLSPLQVSMTKRSHLDLGGAMSPNASVPFLSPRREEFRVVEVPLQGTSMPEKPMCTKKFKRRYVEEDDAASVITSEEDDCISPGYHTSLPMEVHGSCYSEMQMISQASFQQLRCASVIITQHSFDLETFTYYVISTLCQKNQKTYDVFYDWAMELISVCPLSHTMICLLMAQFSARDQLPATPTNCLNCTRKLDCAFHRRQFECRILFTWNMESGEWEVLDYGELVECKLSDLISPIKRCGQTPVSLAQTAKKLAHEMSTSLNKIQDYSSNLRVLESNVRKSKAVITDHDNMLEFYLKRPRNNE